MTYKFSFFSNLNSFDGPNIIHFHQSTQDEGNFRKNFENVKIVGTSVKNIWNFKTASFWAFVEHSNRRCIELWRQWRKNSMELSQVGLINVTWTSFGRQKIFVTLITRDAIERNYFRYQKVLKQSNVTKTIAIYFVKRDCVQLGEDVFDAWKIKILVFMSGERYILNLFHRSGNRSGSPHFSVRIFQSGYNLISAIFKMHGLWSQFWLQWWKHYPDM